MTAAGSRNFSLDSFQLEAIAHIDAARSVVVAAPTGSGKTVVAEHAIDRALAAGTRAFYTAPIKALSNQKYRDLSARIGFARVGLLTGDNTINADAPVVVMTTEVLRNMLYEGRRLDDLGVVVLDEVHYLEDTFRGPVWEEVILNLPEPVQLVCLSATVSNTDELAGWIESTHGATGVVVESKRPVELTNHYVVGDRRGRGAEMIPTLVGGKPNRDGPGFDPEPRRNAADRRRGRSPWKVPDRLELLDLLEARDFLPVIWFIFSRKGCDEAATSIERAGVRFTSGEEAERIREIAQSRLVGIPDNDLAVLGATAWLERLERGIASHHAGLVPAFKEAVELCFAAGLVRIVFATETLALGVNLPARCVVIDKLSKFTGETHEVLTPSQFTQLTGRAGRRGIDERGHAVVPWSPFTQFERVAALAASKSFRLRSAFRPTYNMAVNLLQRHDAEAARALLARSFAQYQADSNISRLEQRLARERGRVEDLRVEVETMGPQPAISTSREDHTQAVADAVSRLRPGDVIIGDDDQRLAVLGVSWRKGGRARIRLVAERGDERRWELADLDHAPITIGTIELPFPMAPERADYRAEVAARLRRSPTKHNVRRRRRGKREADPRADLARAEHEVASLERRARNDSASVARRFDAICGVLRDRGHLDTWTVTDSGRILSRMYSEIDLLVVDALIAEVFDELSPPELASVVSCLTYEHRSPNPPPEPRFPAPVARRRFEDLVGLAKGLARVERHHGVPDTRLPDGGFAAVAHSWAAGEELGVILAASSDMSAGDFVRNAKQLADLLRQLGSLAPNSTTAGTARRAADAIQRGVVAMSGAIQPQ